MINSSDISVIIQGPIDKKITKQSCTSIRKVLPNSEIILSTWDGEDVSDLTYDKIVFSTPPISNQIVMPKTGIIRLNSTNHQIISTNAGLAVASRKYSMKIRSDMVLHHNRFLKFFEKYEKRSFFDEKYTIFSQRVCVFPTYNVHSINCFPFNICDWIYFGYTIDLKYLFDIPLWDTFSLKLRKNEYVPRVDDNVGAEQYIWLSAINKKVSIVLENAFDITNGKDLLSEEWMVNNFILIPSKMYGAECLKMKGGYNAQPWRTFGFYSFFEWETLYKKFCDKKYTRSRFFYHYFIEKPLHKFYVFVKKII